MASVRTVAIEVLGAMYNQIGPRFQSVAVLDSTKPQIKSLIEAEFARVGFDAAASTRASRSSKAEPDESSGGLARVDISKELNGTTFLSELSTTDGKTSWQNRKQAMESLIAACERSGHFVDCNKFVADVMKILKDRVDDAQANNKPIAVNAIAHLVTSLDAESAVKLTKTHVASALIAAFCDIKKSFRDAVVSALDMIVTKNKGDKTADPTLLVVFFPPVAETLKNPNGRQELLTWINSHADALKLDPAIGDWVLPLVSTMQDKVASVRSLAEALLVELSSRSLCAKQKLERGFQDLSPAAMRSLQTSYNKIIQSYGVQLQSQNTAPNAHADDAPEPDTDSSKVPISNSVPLARKGSVSSKPAESAIDENAIPSADKFFLKRILKSAKLKRLEDFPKLNWPGNTSHAESCRRPLIFCLEEPGEAELQALREQWDPFLSY